MVQGSTGGAGLRALEGEEPTPVTLSVLYLDPETRELVAWDDITLGGLGLTSAEIQRHQADEGNGENGPTNSPSPTEHPPRLRPRPPDRRHDQLFTCRATRRAGRASCDQSIIAAACAIRTGLAPVGPTPYAWPVPDGDEPRARAVQVLPPSSSGLGRRPFKAVARVRIPLGARTTAMVLWSSWSARRPVKAEVAGSSPVRTAFRTADVPHVSCYVSRPRHCRRIAQGPKPIRGQPLTSTGVTMTRQPRRG